MGQMWGVGEKLRLTQKHGCRFLKWIKIRFWGGNQESNFGHVRFKTPIGHTCGNVEQAVVSIELDLRLAVYILESLTWKW